MARGQYEQPHARPRPTFGPPRPPIFPSRSSSHSSTSSTSSSPTSPLAPTAAEKSRGVIVVISITKSERYECQIADLKRTLEAEAVVEEIGTFDEALRAFARKPRAVIVSEDALQDPAFGALRSHASRYVETGGCLITDPSKTFFASRASSRMSFESPPNRCRAEYRADNGVKLSAFDQRVLERARDRSPAWVNNSIEQ